MKSSIAIAALVVASVGLAAGGSVFAQSAPGAAPDINLSLGSGAPTPPTSAPPAPSDGPQIGLSLDGSADGPGMLFDAKANMPGRAMGAAGLMMLACSPRGAEELDVALLRLSYRLDLTAQQKPLYDTFREKALTAETSFADTCKTDMPAAAAAGTKPDLLVQLKSRLGIEQARLTALNDVLPSFEAFYDSLTDAQKADLVPHWGAMGGNGMGMHHWWGGNGGRNNNGPATAPSSQL